MRMEGTEMLKTVRTSTLEIAYLESGPAEGQPVVLMHGWPSDVHDWDEVSPKLAAAGYRVLVPYLRGYGPTRFLDAATPRSGQQAALGADLRDFLDALALPPAILAGYDWGGRACCITAAFWPEKVRALVSITGYNIQNIPRAGRPSDAAHEHRLWYQWYLNTDRGEAGVQENRRDFCRLLWRLWSPNWQFDDATFEATAVSFDNPDFAAVTVHSYRHRYAKVPGDPALATLEERLVQQPAISVKTINLHGAEDGVGPPHESDRDARHFTGFYERRIVPVAGHFLPREAPDAVVQAILDLSR
jgi:pimeloyl-ACP methyl ester carboxylesterase